MSTDISIQAIVGTPGSIQPAERRRVPAPRPKSDEAVISVGAFSVNPGELPLLAHRGDGWRPGQDVAGEVIRAAANGSGPPVGTPVAALVDGAGWAGQVAAPTHRLAVVPPTVPLSTAGVLPLIGTTALNLVRRAGPLLLAPRELVRSLVGQRVVCHLSHIRAARCQLSDRSILPVRSRRR